MILILFSSFRVLYWSGLDGAANVAAVLVPIVGVIVFLGYANNFKRVFKIRLCGVQPLLASLIILRNKN